MTVNQKQLAIALVIIALALILGGLLVMDWNVIDPDSAQDWQPAVLETEDPTLTPTSGWWDEMPTPAPVRTPTPTITPTSHE